MKLNLILIVAGLIAVFTGVYRAFPVKLGMRFFLNGGGPLFIILIGFIVLTYKIGGIMKVQDEGLSSTLKISAQFLPMLVLLLPVIGFGSVIAHHFKESLEGIMTNHGFLESFVAAFITPGSNSVAKFVETLWRTPSFRPQLLYFLTATPLVSWQIFLIRQMGFGWEIAATMYKVNFAVAIGLIPVFFLWSKFL